jgi:hypothetical protein
MNFLSNVLREDGGFEYKKAIVDSILILIKDIPDAKEPGLGHLCEFIEASAGLCLYEHQTTLMHVPHGILDGSDLMALYHCLVCAGL